MSHDRNGTPVSSLCRESPAIWRKFHLVIVVQGFGQLEGCLGGVFGQLEV